MTAVEEELNIEATEIKKILDLLSNLFSIRTSFIYNYTNEYYYKELAGQNGDFQPYCHVIQKQLKHKCIACDRDKFNEANQSRKPVLYRCYNGLWEMFLPVLVDDTLVGYLHFGQVRSEEQFEDIRRECKLDQHSEVETLEMYFNKMDVIPKEKLLLIAELFQKIAENILKNQWIELKKNRPEVYLKKYIDENLDQEITIQGAAEYIGRSPSFVTHTFKDLYGTTFYTYVLTRKMEMAKAYLKYKSIEETSSLCGFKNRYHFSKVFKKMTGKTPGNYQHSEVATKA